MTQHSKPYTIAHLAEDFAIIKAMIRREKRMRQNVLRGQKRTQGMQECQNALEALGRIKDAAKLSVDLGSPERPTAPHSASHELRQPALVDPEPYRVPEPGRGAY